MPFAITLTLGSPFENEVGRITHCARYGYDEFIDVCQPVFQGQLHTAFPHDFRTKRQIQRDVLSNKLEALGLTAP